MASSEMINLTREVSMNFFIHFSLILEFDLILKVCSLVPK